MYITKALQQLRLLTSVKVVDNSKLAAENIALGKRVKVIGVRRIQRYPMAGIGDKVTVSINGQVKHGLVVGCVQKQRTFVPRYDTNNIVLIDKQNVPLGTRVTCPLPNKLREGGALTARVMAIATKFC